MFNSKTFATLMILMVVLVAGTAIAQGDVNYGIYGRIHATLDMQNNGDQSTLALNSNSSRIGFRGDAELNDNFTAIWQVESQFNLNEQTTRMWLSRDTFAGVKGDWGSVKVGQFDSPMKDLGQKATFFDDQVGDRRQMGLLHDVRASNQFAYNTNLDGAFSGTFAYMLDQGTWQIENSENATALSVAADFTGESFLIGVAYESRSQGIYDQDPDATGVAAEGTFRVVGNFTGDRFGINGMYQSSSNFFGVDGMSATVYGLEALFKASDAFHIKAGYTMADPDTDTDDDAASLIVFGVDHPVSEDVTFYIQYAMMSNEDNGGFGLNAGNAVSGGWGGSIAQGVSGTAPNLTLEDPNNISLGMMLDF